MDEEAVHDLLGLLVRRSATRCVDSLGLRRGRALLAVLELAARVELGDFALRLRVRERDCLAHLLRAHLRAHEPDPERALARALGRDALAALLRRRLRVLGHAVLRVADAAGAAPRIPGAAVHAALRLFGLGHKLAAFGDFSDRLHLQPQPVQLLVPVLAQV